MSKVLNGRKEKKNKQRKGTRRKERIEDIH